MILENLYGKVMPLDILNDPNTEALPASDEKHNPNFPCVNWKFKDGVLVEGEYGYIQLLHYDPTSKRGLVRDEFGRPVQTPYAMVEAAARNPNPYPVTSRGLATSGPPRPHRKVTANEDILCDGPFGGWLVVDVTTKIVTPEMKQEEKIDAILTTVQENNILLKKLVLK